MNNKLISVEILGENFDIFFSKHSSIERCLERGVSEYTIAALVVALGENLLSLTTSECKDFTIFDDILGEGAVCSMDYNVEDNRYEIDIITVLKTDNVWVRKGQRLFKYSECIKIPDKLVAD